MFEWIVKDNITAANAIYLEEKKGEEGRPFKARFLQAGLVKYDFGVCLLKKETIDKFVNTFIDCPVIINHKDKINKEDKHGVIKNIWFSPEDSWFWCSGYVDDEGAEKVEDEGFNVSCQYRITEYSNNDDNKLHNGNKYDKEILNGIFEHLAIVKTPRYEDAFIAVNAIMATNEDQWITIKPNGEENKGRHLLIKDGETPGDAIRRVYGDKNQKQLFDTSSYKKTKEDYPKVDKQEQKIQREIAEAKRLFPDLLNIEEHIRAKYNKQKPQELSKEDKEFVKELDGSVKESAAKEGEKLDKAIKEIYKQEKEEKKDVIKDHIKAQKEKQEEKSKFNKEFENLFLETQKLELEYLENPNSETAKKYNENKNKLMRNKDFAELLKKSNIAGLEPKQEEKKEPETKKVKDNLLNIPTDNAGYSLRLVKTQRESINMEKAMSKGFYPEEQVRITLAGNTKAGKELKKLFEENKKYKTNFKIKYAYKDNKFNDWVWDDEVGDLAPSAKPIYFDTEEEANEWIKKQGDNIVNPKVKKVEEWHHISGGGKNKLIDINALADLGFKIDISTANKEFKLKEKAKNEALEKAGYEVEPAYSPDIRSNNATRYQDVLMYMDSISDKNKKCNLSASNSFIAQFKDMLYETLAEGIFNKLGEKHAK